MTKISRYVKLQFSHIALPYRFLLLFLLLFLTTTTNSPRHLAADEKLKGIACRSVHFGYPGDNALLFYNEITVKKSAPGTYFCVIGWNKGYFGIQQLANNKRVAIFSVWDSGDNDPNALSNEKRTQVLYVDPQVSVKRFGGEGSGGQSFLPFEWKEGQTYKFAVVSRDLQNRTAFSGWLFDPMTEKWRHLITFSTITGGKPMNGFYSFVEDFKRDRKSTQFTRSAVFSKMFRYNSTGEIVGQTNARFTGDSNPVTNIDAEVVSTGIQLSTGGTIKNDHIQLNQTFNVPSEEQFSPKWVHRLIESSQQNATTPTERKSRSHKLMQTETIPFLERLGELPSIGRTSRRSAEQVWQRLLIETALALKADRTDENQWKPIAQRLPEVGLTSEESEFLLADRTNVNDEIRYLWHAERAMVLAWSLGLAPELPWAENTTTPQQLLEVLLPSIEKPDLNLLPQNAILDQADLTYRLHWSVLNARYMDRDAPDHLQVDVLLERHHTFAWLLGLKSLEQAETADPASWNEVQPQVGYIREFATPIKE